MRDLISKAKVKDSILLLETNNGYIYYIMLCLENKFAYLSFIKHDIDRLKNTEGEV